MKRFLQKWMLASAFVITGLFPAAFAQQSAPTGQIQAQQKLSEKESIAALIRLGVPVQVDPRGSARWIEAAKAELSDEAMRYLPYLKNLEWLEIGSGAITASGLANLKDCVSLKRLYIHDLDLKGSQLEWLANLKNLEALSLQRTGIDGRVLENIKATDTLLVLNLSGNRIVDDDIGQIAKIKGLEVLSLADTKITGDGLEKLEGMARLNELNLVNCTIDDADIESFMSMPNLRIVYAAGCNISDMAIYGMTARFQMLAIFR